MLIIKYSILIIIFLSIGFIIFLKNEETISETVTEAFQTMLQTPYFNITNYDNYFKLNKDEESSTRKVNLEELILDIGGGFGDFDAASLPWDTENKELLQSEAVWGFVPNDATIALFKKVYFSNQLQAVGALPFDSITNQFYYQDPIFSFGTDNKEIAKGFEIGQQVLMAGMTLYGMYSAFGDYREALEAAKKASAAKAAGGAKSVPLSTRALKAFNSLRMSGVVTKVLKGKGAINAGVKAAMTISKRSTSFAKLAVGATKALITLLKGVLKLVNSIVKNVIKLVTVILRFVISNLLTTVVKKYFGITMFLYAINPALGLAFDVVVSPLLLLLSLPNGPITAAMDKWADSEGSCPHNSKSLDEILPPPTDMILGMVPVFGDLFGFFYPYLCVDNSTGLLITKGVWKAPKYIMNGCLSTNFWPWPAYKGNHTPSRLVGKYIATELYPSQQGHRATMYKLGQDPLNGSFTPENRYDVYNLSNNMFDLYHPLFLWGLPEDPSPGQYKAPVNYFDFNDIINLGDSESDYRSLNNVIKRMDGLKPTYHTEYFFPKDLLPDGAKFYYADFSDPTMLVDIGQFYYKLAMANPTSNIDGTVSVEIISKINYVVASSLYSCDVECEILNVTYDPASGKMYDEYITLGHDRRFYFNVNYDIKAQPYWENSANIEWKTLDNRYDFLYYNLNEYLNRYNIFYPTDDGMANVIVTAYEQMLDSGRSLSNLVATSNYTSDDYNSFNSNYRVTIENYNELITGILRENPADRKYKERIDFRVSSLVGVKDELWELQKRLRPVSDSNRNPQYTVYGCTHINDTASAAFPADISLYQDDIRKRVNFDILPYLPRCQNTYIDTRKCIDPSNIQEVIEKYKEKYPNKDIKSIVNIKPQGRNACTFTWDEVTTGQSDLTRKKYNILYQTDLSSCTFYLPNTLVAEASSNLQGSDGLPTIETIKMYKNPITDPISQVYNPLYNTRLSYRKAEYYEPVITYSNNVINNTSNITSTISYNLVTNVDTIPRFDNVTRLQISDLVRPKRPIRVSYPMEPEKHLGTDSNDFCSDPDTLTKFILDYNKTNPANKILSVVKAYTTDSNTCDLLVDLLFKYSQNNNTVQRRTLSFNVKKSEGFENIYTYDSINNTDGLNIRPNTSNLAPPYKEKGVTYGKPFLNDFNTNSGITSNIRFFDNDLVTDYTKNTSGIVNSSRQLLIDLKDAILLGDDACRKKCDDPEIMQRIMEQYNNDNQAKGRYFQDNNKMYTIFKSATESDDRCHLYFAQTNDFYVDYYATDKTNSNNYISESRPALRSVSMKQLPGTCDFAPITGQMYLDISATDAALQSGVDVFANDSSFYRPVRENCTNLDCKNNRLIQDAIADYQNKSGSRVTRVFKTMKVGNDTCDYNIMQDLSYEGRMIPNVESILRVRYKYPIYKDATPGCGEFTYERATVYDRETYISDTFELQFAMNLEDDNISSTSPIFSYMNNPNDPIASAIQNIP